MPVGDSSDICTAPLNEYLNVICTSTCSKNLTADLVPLHPDEMNSLLTKCGGVDAFISLKYVRLHVVLNLDYEAHLGDEVKLF